MWFKHLCVMFYLVGSDSKKKEVKAKSGRDRDRGRRGEGEKLNHLGVKPLPLACLESHFSASRKPNTH